MSVVFKPKPFTVLLYTTERMNEHEFTTLNCPQRTYQLWFSSRLIFAIKVTTCVWWLVSGNSYLVDHRFIPHFRYTRSTAWFCKFVTGKHYAPAVPWRDVCELDPFAHKPSCQSRHRSITPLDTSCKRWGELWWEQLGLTKINPHDASRVDWAHATREDSQTDVSGY